MPLHHRGPILYNRPGNPLNEIPLDLADLSFNHSGYGTTVGNGRYDGPLTVAGTGFISGANGWVFTDAGAAGSVGLNNVGALVVTTSTTDESSTQIQQTSKPYRYTTTNRIRCFARLATSTAITTDAFFGLSIADTTIIATSAEDVTDCIGFFKAATATDWSFLVQKGGTATTTALGLTLTDAAFALIGFEINKAVCRVYGVLDPSDQLLTSPNLLGAGTAVALTNVPDTQDLVFSIAAGQEGGTTARTLTVDWGFAHQTHA